MIDEVKKIKLEELNNQKMQYEENKKLINQKLDQIRDKLNDLEIERQYGMTVKKEISFIEKLITRRNEYKKYKEQSKRVSKLPQIIDETQKEFNEENRIVEQKLEESGIKKDLIEVIEKIKLTEKAKTLYEIGINPVDAMKLLESKGIQPVLTENDKCIYEHSRDYSSKSSLIGVHKTQYKPTANMIKSAKDANVKYKNKITINEVEYEYSYKSGRDTVHMAMNDEVSSHAYGSWDDCKYAVLIPFEDIPNEKIGRVAPQDTFTKGSIELSENSWILCPKNEVKELKTFNPKVHVLGYDGENVLGYSQPFLTQLGYRAEDVGMWSWGDEKSACQYRELMAKEGLKIGAHTHTYFHEDEECLASISEAVSISKLLKDNHLIEKQEDIQNIMKQLHFENILSDLYGKSIIEGSYEPQAIKGNGKQLDVFFDEMRKNGFNIATSYQEIIKKLCKTSISDYNKEKSKDVFNISSEISETERNTIKELQKSLNSEKSWEYGEKEVAFGKFLSTAIGESILNIQEKEVAKEKVNEER